MKKIYKQNISIILISIFLFSMLSGFGINLLLNKERLSDYKTVSDKNELFKTSQIDMKDIKIAIYNEPNVSDTSYSSTSTFNNNYTGLISLLTTNGYTYTELTTNDIYNHKLITADFDIFVMMDNGPKDNITNLVKEFWLGGGSILSFDSGLSYLMYSGIFLPESVNDGNPNTYWSYAPSDTQNISIRHPTTKGYQIGDKYSVSYATHAYINWSAAMGSTIAADLTKISNIDGNNNRASGIALDPTEKGGKVVQLPGILDTIDSTFNDLILDSIQWLCPTPKARIAFDLTHQPRLGVDDWDDLAGIPGYYPTFRDEIVSRGYLFDKLYPSTSGNYTSSRLNIYDVLIIVSPDLNTSASEQNNLNSWIANGGSLLILGERPSGIFLENNKRINFLLKDTGLELNSIYGTGVINNLIFNIHPTTEGCTNIYMGTRGAINISGSAFPIWKYAGNIYIAGQEYGNGRIIITSDINWAADSDIGNDDNSQYAINIINWLSAAKASVLLYTTEYTSPNYFQTPVAKALNKLNIKFYLTANDDYLNLSLSLYSWNFLIIDQPSGIITTEILNSIEDYVENEGRLLMSSYRVDDLQSHSLWSTLGFKFVADMPDKSPIYIWESGNDIFNKPIAYGANNFTPNYDYFDEGDLLTVYPNATALAGYTETYKAGNATIVLRNDRKTLYNGYLIDQFNTDMDDSTYEDRLELWINEISYMMYPYTFSLSSNADDPDDDGTFDLQWTTSELADHYDVSQRQDGGSFTQIASSLTTTTYPLINLTSGNYSFYIKAINNFGVKQSNTIEIEVEIPTEPPGPSGPNGGIPGFNIGLVIMISLSMIGLILVILKRKRIKV